MLIEFKASSSIDGLVMPSFILIGSLIFSSVISIGNFVSVSFILIVLSGSSVLTSFIFIGFISIGFILINVEVLSSIVGMMSIEVES